MARDFENIHNIDELSDDELRGLVREHLHAHNGLDVDDFSVRVDDGTVVLMGRVGTDGERRIAEHVVTDVLGIVSVRNEIVVDPLRRAESPMDIEDHLAEEDRTEGLLLGDRPRQTADSAPDQEELEEEERIGSTDVGDVIANGVPWIPPESPTQEGFDGTGIEGTERTGEDH
ncbi:MAG TPA: BON domain-containing protein [Gemmatimonadaceae bacterium]